MEKESGKMSLRVLNRIFRDFFFFAHHIILVNFLRYKMIFLKDFGGLKYLYIYVVPMSREIFLILFKSFIVHVLKP